MSAFIDDADTWLMIGGLAVMAWGFWPQWKRQLRRYLRHRDWERSPL